MSEFESLIYACNVDSTRRKKKIQTQNLEHSQKIAAPCPKIKNFKRPGKRIMCS
jgi:hypothetical protein